MGRSRFLIRKLAQPPNTLTFGRAPVFFWHVSGNASLSRRDSVRFSGVIYQRGNDDERLYTSPIFEIR